MLILVAIILLLGFIALWFWMKNEFKALSLNSIEKNSQQFMNLAENTLQPLKESMKLLNDHQRELERRREGAYSAISKQIETLVLSEKELRAETTRLTQALKSPQIRGSWGEVHLRRVIELAGLVNHCDFYEQKTFNATGRVLRPDLVVHLPGGRQIAIDAKTPLNAYLEAAGAENEEIRKTRLQEHVLSLKKHIKELASKEYFKQFTSSPEYVVLFLPAEAFFSAALQVDPTLIEVGVDQNVIVATPTTLIAILRAVASGWKQESLSKSAAEIAKLGTELYDRIGVLCDHWNKVGRNLNTAVDAFNQSIASLESRVLVSARKLKESGAMMKELPRANPIEKITRTIEVGNEDSSPLTHQKG